ncbi:putative Ig domain-containing protein [Spirosoma oryzicola]|uniref:putative Ig domain-containing protein n=1 Tax=Spirosoma oryzicola TaxID=2898794 RepID=UPI001E562198|nr:putative Ig domain-containing protein [Spirosoma oryzicola]UHG89597.1 putative Ig domain-containing protein [Spirosoma oryzicola]
MYIDAKTSKLEASYSDIQGGYTGVGNINQDPLFVDANRGDYHLKPGSPAINAGDPNSTEVSTSDKDLDGNPRILQNRIDMGVYEHPPVGFAITSVGGVSCQLVNADRGEYNVQFAPQYTGQNSNPISFSVVNELSATNRPAPYTLRLYRDNPTITLVANQAGNPEARFRYDWLSSCQSGTSTNQAPTTTGVANQTILQGQPYQLQLSSYFTDPDGQALTYSALGLPQGLELNGSVITGTPSQTGIFTVSITAFDPAGLSVKASFALTIKQTSSTPTSFTITGASTIKCEALSANKRLLTFTPQYAGVSGEPISFSVVNEKLPTSNPGPYDLELYTDNPTIRLSARQGTSAVNYTYNWLAACGRSARIGNQEYGVGLSIKVLGNPVVGPVAQVEISGVTGQTVQLQLVDQQGKPLYKHNIEEASAVERVSLPLGDVQGVLFLDISTANERQQVKLVRP